MTAAADDLAAALEAAEPAGSRPLAGLVARLAATGRLRAVAPPPGVDAGAAAVRGIAYDSRRVVPGGLFVAVPGAHVDGHAFAGAAIAAGAAVLVVERAAADPGPAVQVLVDRSQLALAVVAAWWYGDPGRELGVVGVTGTAIVSVASKPARKWIRCVIACAPVLSLITGQRRGWARSSD